MHSAGGYPPESLRHPQVGGGSHEGPLFGGGADGSAAWRLHPDQQPVPGSKRGVEGQDLASWSPRSVRARLLKEASAQQQPPAARRGCPFATVRRCSFVEQRQLRGKVPLRGIPELGQQPPLDHEPDRRGAFDEAEASYSHDDSAVQQLQLSVLDSRDSSELTDPSCQGHTSPPVKEMAVQANRESIVRRCKDAEQRRPVTKATMAVQTNRESIVRHYRNNGGDDPLSSDDEDFTGRIEEGQDGNAAAVSPRELALLSQGRDVTPQSVQSIRSDLTGLSVGTAVDNMSCLNTSRSVLGEMRYPRTMTFDMSALAEDVMKRASAKKPAGHAECRTALAHALSCAVMDESVEFARSWGVGRAGGEKRVEDRVAVCLQKLASKAEKACMRKLLVQEDAVGNAAQDDADADLRERCSQIEAKLAAADRRVAHLKEALQNPQQQRELDQLNTLRELTDRLSASADEDEASPSMDAFGRDIDGCIQALIGATQSCHKMLERCQEAQRSEKKSNKDVCVAEAAAVEDGPRGALRRLP